MRGQIMNYPLTTNAIVEYGNRVFPHKEIISYLPDGSRHSYTFHDLYKRSKKLAHVLVEKLGIQPSDRIGTFAWNHYQHVELYYGIPGAGAICHTINIRLSTQQIEFIIQHAEDRVIFVDYILLKLLESIQDQIKHVELFVIINAPKDIETSLSNYIHYEELISQGNEDFEWIPIDENDACALCYTSGTTGDPKGALYAHRSTYLHAMGIMSPNAIGASAKDRILLVVPQFHVMAWGFPYLCMLSGSDMVMPSLHLQPDKLVDIMVKEKVTLANGVPTIWLGVYDFLKSNPPTEKLALKEFFVGGSAMPASLLEAFDKSFNIKGIHLWGMTETSPLGTSARLQNEHLELSPEELLQIRAKQGIEMPGVELRVVLEDGSIAPRDGKTVGEFQIRGAWIIDSYYKMPQNQGSFSEDGWFKTGDVGTIDSKGYMQITDRTKDLIKSGGEWISSVALETKLMAHPAVKEAAVIAIPDEKWVERPLACVVVDEAFSPTDASMIAFLSTEFTKYQIPEIFVRMKEIPKTSVGKFDKKEMRRRFAEGIL